jgi:hypothetical protein
MSKNVKAGNLRNERKGITNRRNLTEDEKEHICATCGKKYARYPSLFTHIKVKHDNISPLDPVAGFVAIVPSYKPPSDKQKPIK